MTEKAGREPDSRPSQDFHRSVFAHLTRRMADPDHPGQEISYGELELRLLGRAYRRAVSTGQPERPH